MRTGRQRLEAKLQTNTPTRDAAGGETASWADTVATWYCELAHVSGGETFRGRMVSASAQFVAVGQYVDGVNSRMRMTSGSRTFDILQAYDPDGRGRELRLDLKERGV